MLNKYEPSEFEEKIYKNWEEKGYFRPAEDKGQKTYCIMMPPPNVTGKLHMGHALDDTLQDILIRFKRMQGYNTLWLPGSDHAAIATEAKIVEKMKENPNARYSDMFDEWQVKDQIVTSSIIGIGLPMRWLDGVDWRLCLNSLQELKEILSIAEALGLDIVDSSRENFVEEYELEKRKNPHKIYQIQLDCILGSDTSE